MLGLARVNREAPGGTRFLQLADLNTRSCAPSEAYSFPPDGTVDFSPDGAWLAVVQRDGVRVVGAAGLWRQAAAPVPPARPSEAERLLAAMDAKIRAAKTLRIEFEVRYEDDLENWPLAKGSLLVADRNRFRFWSENRLFIPGSTQVVVSDGKRIGGEKPFKDAPPFPPLRDWHNEVIKSCLGALGAWPAPALALGLADRAGGKRPAVDDLPRAANAKMLPDEVVDGIKARVVAYDLSWRLLEREGETMTYRVWIDPKTGLPLRYRVMSRKNGHTTTYILTHTKFEIDPKLDDKLFEVPK